MENLTKQQLVLLTILVSFVTSIATGITTVSLLTQATPSVNQTINRVVERTIETVVPAEPKKDEKTVKEVPTKEVTVMVRQEDEIVKALQKNSQSVVRIKSNDGLNAFYGLAIVISADGKVVADANSLPKNVKIAGVFANGTFPLTVVATNEKEQLVTLKAQVPETQTVKFVPVIFANSENIRLGQTAVAISGQDKNVVSIGIVSGVGERDGPVGANGTPTKYIYSLDTSFSLSSVTSGTPIINTTGEVIGFKVGNGTGNDLFKASNVVKMALQ